MNSRERVIAAIEFKSPDRIPHRHAFLPAVFEKYQEVENLYKRFPSDFAGEEGLFQDSIAYRAGEWEDEWGCVWQESIYFHSDGYTIEILPDAALGSFNGGFIACSELAPDQPWENIVAILETFFEYREYPLKIGWDGKKSRYRKKEEKWRKD